MATTFTEAGSRASSDATAQAQNDRIVHRSVKIWLGVVCVLIVFLMVFGGFVRLARAGLSITEWNVISGVVPPLTDSAWRAEFAKYQQTPEFKLINASMTLVEYQEIFLIEWAHRLIGRIAGLAVVIPLIFFVVRGIILWRRSGIYVFIAALFALQGAIGWYMVSSGLDKLPHVSPYRLTMHLLLALTLLGLTVWVGMNYAQTGDWRRAGQPTRTAPPRRASRTFAVFTLALLVLQIAYGGLVAGLKAGHASNTWPLMFGELIPSGLLSAIEPWWLSALEAPATVQFIHRWLAFGVLGTAVATWLQTRGDPNARPLRRLDVTMLALVGVQIALGVGVIVMFVPLTLALAHQANALLLFVVVVALNHRLLHPPTVASAGALVA